MGNMLPIWFDKLPFVQVINVCMAALCLLVCLLDNQPTDVLLFSDWAYNAFDCHSSWCRFGLGCRLLIAWLRVLHNPKSRPLIPY